MSPCLPRGVEKRVRAPEAGSSLASTLPGQVPCRWPAFPAIGADSAWLVWALGAAGLAQGDDLALAI